MTIRSGPHEVVDGRPLGGELGVRDVADLVQAAIVEPVPHAAARPDGHRALHGDDDPPLDLRELVDDGPDGGEIRVAGVGRGRAHRDVDDVRALDRLCDVGREDEPLRVRVEKLGESVLVDRHVPGAEHVDLLGDDVAHDHFVPELGEARAGDETDVARSEDRDPHGPSSLPLDGAEGLQALGDRDHRLVGEPVEEGVDHSNTYS